MLRKNGGHGRCRWHFSGARGQPRAAPVHTGGASRRPSVQKGPTETGGSGCRALSPQTPKGNLNKNPAPEGAFGNK